MPGDTDAEKHAAAMKVEADGKLDVELKRVARFYQLMYWMSGSDAEKRAKILKLEADDASKLEAEVRRAGLLSIVKGKMSGSDAEKHVATLQVEVEGQIQATVSETMSQRSKTRKKRTQGRHLIRCDGGVVTDERIATGMVDALMVLFRTGSSVGSVVDDIRNSLVSSNKYATAADVPMAEILQHPDAVCFMLKAICLSNQGQSEGRNTVGRAARSRGTAPQKRGTTKPRHSPSEFAVLRHRDGGTHQCRQL